MQNIKSVLERESCTGCTACNHSCPFGAISMIEDPEGFLYPEVKDDICTNCGICTKVCPVINAAKKDIPKTVFGAKASSLDTRLKSSSGGLFSLFAEKVINEGGIVFGAAYDRSFKVVHKSVACLDEIDKLRGAKYSQSDLSNTFLKNKHNLKVRKVLFVGTPCQCSGLFNYLNQNSDPSFIQNLILIDFICHSIPSPKVWARYLEWRSKNKEILRVNQRSKSTGWSNYSYSLSLDFSDGKRTLIPNSDDVYMKLFIGDYITRPSCSICNFKGCQRVSDLTLGDYWGIWNSKPDFDDNQGVSLVMVNSDKGASLLSSVEDKIELFKANIIDALKENPAYFETPRKPSNRNKILFQALEGKFDDLESLFINNQDFIGHTFSSGIGSFFKGISSGIKKTFKKTN